MRVESLSCNEANAHIQQLQKQLDDCRAQILRFVPTGQISDKNISEEVETLYQGLFNWVASLPDIIGFGTMWPIIYHGRKQQGNTFTYNVSVYSEIVVQAQSELLAHALFCHVYHHLFKPSFLGASEWDRSLLEKLLAHIRQIEPKKVRLIKAPSNQA